MKRTALILALFVSGSMLLTSCFRDERKPGREYIPDMAHGIAYEAYQENPNFENGSTAGEPVEGTIPRGALPNDEANSIDYLYSHHAADADSFYLSSGNLIKNPLKGTDAELAEGKRLYTINCAICHGDKGDGTGHIVETEKFPAVPTSYFDERLLNMPDGQMFHVLTYGRNLMGSYASQLNSSERWMVVAYVKALQAEYSAAQNTGEDAAEVDASAEAEGDADAETETESEENNG
jgi:mono/diheme cytochrome c family protein